MEYQCKTCLETKKETEFYRDKSYKSGFGTNACKSCLDAKRKDRRKEYWVTHRNEYHAKMREYSKNHYQDNKERYAEHSAKARDKYPEKYKARYQLRNAVASGEVEKLPCIKCGNEKSHGHHEDYNKPLEVIWLCQHHHAELHREKRFRENYGISKAQTEFFNLTNSTN